MIPTADVGSGRTATGADLAFLRRLSDAPVWTGFLQDWGAEPDPVRRVDLGNAFCGRQGRLLPGPTGELLPRLLVMARESGYRMGQATTLANLGWNRLDRDDYQAARSFLIEGLELARELGGGENLLRCLNGLGACYTDMGLFERAISHYREALEEADRGQLVEHHGLILTNLARCHIDLGQWDQARSCLEQVVETPSSQPINRAIRLHRLAIVRRHQGQPAEAAELLGQALELAGPYPSLGLQCRVELSAVMLETGQAAAAGELLDGVLAAVTEAGDPRGRIEALLARAGVAEATGEAGLAVRLLEAALDGADRLGAGILRVQSCRRLAAHFESRGDFQTAYGYSERCRKLEQELSRVTNALLIAGFEEEKSRREAQLYREQYAQMLAIGEIGRLITSSLELGRIIDTIHSNLHRLMPVDALLIGLHDPVGDCLRFRSNLADGLPLPEYSLGVAEPNLATRCFRSQEPILINNLAAEYERYPTDELVQSWQFPMAGLLFAPLQHGVRTIGVLGVQCRRAGVYNAHHLNTLVALASYVAIALENASLYEQLRVLANEDNLTGFLNRRSFAEVAEEELRRAIRYGETVTFMMVDLDHFKNVNDSWGHAAGDLVLQAAARLIRGNLRDSDAVCRWGGEEFALMLPHTDLEGGRLLAERIRSALAALDIDLGNGRANRVTASFGVAQRQVDENSYESAIRRADRALYQAKHAGRDRVCLDQSAGGTPPAERSS
jgi:diguanylate cyclase (GGDEF)-like protein